MMVEKLRTALWFLRRPDHNAHALALAVRKVSPDLDAPNRRARARGWAAERAQPVGAALSDFGLLAKNVATPTLPADGTDPDLRATRSGPDADERS
jgi:hypothetical protein